MPRCLNLCEINWSKLCDHCGVMNKLYGLLEEKSRIYVGSYFCSQFFWAFQFDNLIKFAKDWNLKLTLVLPIFSEKDLKLAKKKIIKILQNSKSVIDEVTVNDFGMLTYIQSKFDKKVNLGRLFFKDPRDVRVNEYYSQKGNVNILSALEEVIDVSKINYVELDETNKSLGVDDCFRVAVHTPFCFMTTGNICKYASINKGIEFKFRPNDKCRQECSCIYEHYSEEYNGRHIDLYRLGRTVYSYMTERSEVENKKREIYFPFIEIVNSTGDKNENFSAVK